VDRHPADLLVETPSPAAPSVATAPVNWNNADLGPDAPQLPFAALLDEMAAAGYDATEYGGNFPTVPDALTAGLVARGMRLCGAYQGLPLLDPDAMADGRPALNRLLGLLAAVGCRDLIVAFALTPDRIALAGHVPADGSAGLSDAQWRTTVDHLSRVAEAAASHGLRTHFHNHVGSYVETPTEVDRLLHEIDPALLDLCFDAGHYAYGGGDPVAFVAAHHDRIGYVHLKDVDPVALADARQRGLSFLEALRGFVFCELGQGIVDVPAIATTLRETGYRGWLVVEQDTTPRPPTESARANRGYLRERCGL